MDTDQHCQIKHKCKKIVECSDRKTDSRHRSYKSNTNGQGESCSLIDKKFELMLT